MELRKLTFGRNQDGGQFFSAKSLIRFAVPRASGQVKTALVLFFYY